MSVANRLHVVTQELPEPPYPEATKANGFKQEVDWDRVAQSRTWIYADNEVRPWLLMLWLKSWQNVPAGTWEADDEYIARSLGCKLEFFIGHREQFMRGWVRHADGRLYHPFITAQVLEMLGRRRATANRVKEHRQKNQVVTKTGSTEETQCNALHSVTYAKEQEQEQEQKDLRVAKATVEPACGGPDLASSENVTPLNLNGATKQVLAVFDYWRVTLNHPQSILDNKRRKAIAARIKEGYSVDKIKRAIDGCKASAWHQGKNNRQTVYDDIELICRDAKHVEDFITRVVGKSTQQRELDAWINHDNFIEGECRHVQA